MAPDTADLVLEDLVVEAGLELALAGAGGGDVHGGLAAAEDDEVLLRGDAGAVERGVGGVGLEQLEVAGGHEAGGLVLGGGDEVGAVGGPLQVGHGLVEFVDGDVEVLLAGLGGGKGGVSGNGGIASDERRWRKGKKKNGRGVHTLPSYWETEPSSWPAMMYLFR